MVTHTHTNNHSLLWRAFAPFILSWKLQIIIYGTTFCVALTTALVTDFVLGQSRAFAAMLSLGVVFLLLFVTPIVSVTLHDRRRRTDAYATLQTEFEHLLHLVDGLAEQIEVATQPSEVPLSHQGSTDLELLSKTAHSSALELIQDMVFSDARLRVLSTKKGELSTLTLPVGFKSLLEHVAKANGFVSSERYLEFILAARANKMREAKESEIRDFEARRSLYAKPGYGKMYEETTFPRPSRSSEQWHLKLESSVPLDKVKTR